MLRVSAADLRDFFYFFKVTPQRLQRNVLKGSISTAEAAQLFGYDCSGFADSEGRVRLGLAMGDSSACEFAQGSHLAVL